MTTTDKVRLQIATKKSRYVSTVAVSGPDEKAITNPIINLITPKRKRIQITAVASPLKIDDIDSPPVI
jgi:hypothetical protein